MEFKEFSDTGLPKDPTLYKAFMTYLQNASSLSDTYNKGFSVEVAQILNDAGTRDSTLLAAAILMPLPTTTWGALEKRFGAPVIEILRETQQHIRTGYAYIDSASQGVKQLSAASTIRHLNKMRADLEDQPAEPQDASFDILGGQEQEEQNQPRPIMVPSLPSMTVFNRFDEAFSAKTGNDILEQRYTQTLADFKSFNRDFVDQLVYRGVLPADVAQELVQEAPAYPDFDTTGILNDAKVRAVYEQIVKDPRVQPEDFVAAFNLGRILSSQPSVSPTAVAAGMLDIATPSFGKEDIAFVQGRIDWDVLEVLEHDSVYRTEHTKEALEKTSPEFRQILLANAYLAVAEAEQLARDVVQALRTDPGIPKEYHARLLRQNLLPLRGVIRTNDNLLTHLGDTGAPELENLTRNRNTTFSAFLESALEIKKPAQKPGPKPGNDPTV